MQRKRLVERRVETLAVRVVLHTVPVVDLQVVMQVELRELQAERLVVLQAC